MGDLSSLLGSIDPGMIAKLLPVLSQLNRPESGETTAFLRALRPFLKPERQDKVERAAQLARFIHLGKTLLLSEGGRAMYNRYLRNDDGVYTRMPMQDAPRGEPPRDNRPPPPPPSGRKRTAAKRRRGTLPLRRRSVRSVAVFLAHPRQITTQGRGHGGHFAAAHSLFPL